jgi:uncharacterized protein
VSGSGHHRRQGAVFRVHVTPRSEREELIRHDEGELRVRLTAAPVQGKANLALVKFLARILGVPRRDVEIVSGVASRHKRVRIASLSAEELGDRLDRLTFG